MRIATSNVRHVVQPEKRGMYAEISTHRPSLMRLSDELGECVYFIRCNDGLIKIGWTRNLAQRKRSFRVGWDAILAALPGTLDDEQALHRRFAGHLVRGREYYAPMPDLLDHIDQIRDRYGLGPVEIG